MNLNNKLLAISSSTQTLSKSTENLNPLENREMLIWIIALILIIAVCVIIGLFGPKIKSNITKKKEMAAIKKSEKERNAELERLHKIKEKNKRK